MPRKVLVVDDEPNIVRLARINLVREGYLVTSAADGVEALEQVQCDRPDAILLDVMMPRIDGFATLQKLKGDPDTAAIPVIMLTAQAHDSALLYGKQAGAAHYMTKPFNPAELAAVMRQVLADAKDDDGPAS